MHWGVYLRSQHAEPLGDAGSVQQYHTGLDSSERSGGSACDRRRQGDGVYLRGLQGGDGYGQQGVHRDDDRGGRQRQGIPVSHPDIFHNTWFWLVGHRKQPTVIWNDREVRNTVFFQLYQLWYGALRCAQHVLPSASRPAGVTKKNRWFLWIGREHGECGGRHDQPAAHRVSGVGRGGFLQTAWPPDGHQRPLPQDQAECDLKTPGGGVISIYEALSGQVWQPFLDDRPDRHERGGAQREMAQGGPVPQGDTAVCKGCPEPYEGAPVWLSGAVRRSV